MAVITKRSSTPSTSNATSYAAGAFTPAANDLLIAFVTAGATAGTGTMTDNQGGSWTKVGHAVFNTSGDRVYCFVRNSLATNVSTTVTFDCSADAADGAVVDVYSVSGMTRTGISAIRQSKNTDNGAAAGTPAVTFAAACLTGNPVIGMVGNLTNPATITPPTSFTEQTDSGYATPTHGCEVASRDSGHTSATVTWGSTSATAFGVFAIELDTSAPPLGKIGLLSPRGLAETVMDVMPIPAYEAKPITGPYPTMLGGTAATVASGASLTQNVNDSVTPSDALTFDRTILVADSVTPSDAQTKDQAILIAETVPLADAPNKDQGKSVQDTLSIADNAQAERGIPVAVNDSVTPSDALTFGWGPGINDTVGLADAQTKDQAILVEDNAAISDAIAQAESQTLNDSLSIADQVTPVLGAAPIATWLQKYPTYAPQVTGPSVVFLGGTFTALTSAHVVTVDDSVSLSDEVMAGKPLPSGVILRRGGSAYVLTVPQATFDAPQVRGPYGLIWGLVSATAPVPGTDRFQNIADTVIPSDTAVFDRHPNTDEDILALTDQTKFGIGDVYSDSVSLSDSINPVLNPSGATHTRIIEDAVFTSDQVVTQRDRPQPPHSNPVWMGRF